MGQTIEILRTTVIEQVLVIDTDRSLAGQDGDTYADPAEARAAGTFPAQLAARLFESDDAVDHVFVMSNTVSVRRSGGWTEEQVDQAAGIVAAFFRFYPD